MSTLIDGLTVCRRVFVSILQKRHLCWTSAAPSPWAMRKPRLQPGQDSHKGQAWQSRASRKASPGLCCQRAASSGGWTAPQTVSASQRCHCLGLRDRSAALVRASSEDRCRSAHPPLTRLSDVSQLGAAGVEPHVQVISMWRVAVLMDARVKSASPNGAPLDLCETHRVSEVR